METLEDRIEWLENYRATIILTSCKGSLVEMVRLNTLLQQIEAQLDPTVLEEWNRSRRKAVIEELIDWLEDD